MTSTPHASLNRRIIQSAGIVIASVLLSRILGFAREWTVAHEFGSNAVTDAYYAAFTLPDFLNYLVAGAFLSLTFIPVLTRCIAENREEDGWRVFSTVISFMGLALVGLVIVGEVCAPELVTAIAPGFRASERDHVIFLTRLMLPAQIFFYEGGILSAVQYAKGQFVVPSLAPLIYNIAIILGGVLLASQLGITGFAVGVLAGAFTGNFLLQIYGARRAGARYLPNLHILHPDFGFFVKLTIPIMLAFSIVFTDDWIIRFFGSYLVPASITWLTYAKNLMRVPLGVVGQAVGVAAFPFLAQLYAEKRFEELNHTINATLKGLMLILLPISALTIAESRPLVYMVFSHTRLRPPDLDATAATLEFFSLGMFAWGAQNIVARGFYAARDTLTPAISGTVMTVLTLPVYWFLSRRMEHLGLALASSIGVIAYTAVLFVLLNRRIQNAESTALLVFLLKMGIASTIGALACREVASLLEARVHWQSAHDAFLVVLGASAVGFMVTGAGAKALGVRELGIYMRKLVPRLWPASKT
ncbi:MAG: murein biosynthesis integral membrane protein MurJ [Terriglobia bacterium]